ncbi:DUF1674 domain-containing protein [uncultured Alsobacter sp.]|uniref:DUF1674 domain-containing protein n=1 Tax=uncultured Alsobacter sp. TaxID=1748258 RepID=UPI0025E2ABD1|nr:DUF1674 domain-containing protein [uncultured Alsobacter sp.]
MANETKDTAVGAESTAPETPPRVLSPAARRALAEAEARRAAVDAHAAELAGRPEKDGRGGLEPVRYGDWEIKGLTSDF